jgi:[histone H3]-lysine36 N-dimethyltransferase SETMAR
MDLNREHFRAMIFYDFKSGLTQQQCVKRLNSAFGNEAPSKATVYNWYNEFKSGRFYLSDEFREGRPMTAVTQENIEAIRNLIKSDRHVTYREISSTLGIGMTAISKILNDHLGVRKLCSRWVPHNLTSAQKDARVKWCKEMLRKYNKGSSKAVYDICTGDESWIYNYDPETKQQSTVWVFQNEAKPTKVVRSRSVLKKMVASFFKITGHVATVALDDRKTVNADWYTTICLPEVIGEIRKNNRKRRIILHHDNASAHTADLTTAFLSEEKVELMSHSPYSPDLAPCDFFLFPAIKKKLRGIRFASSDSAVEAYKNELLQIPPSDWSKCFEDWFTRMQTCVNFKGEYFEKQ